LQKLKDGFGDQAVVEGAALAKRFGVSLRGGEAQRIGNIGHTQGQNIKHEHSEWTVLGILPYPA